MIPGNTISSTLEYASYLSPDNLEVSDTLDYELGGVGINNPADGLEYQTWTLRVVPTGGILDPVDIKLSAPNTPEFTLFSDVGISAASLAFDQNMQPFVAFVQNGNAKFRWYDATVPAFVVTDLPAGSTTPKCTLDDKRALQTRLGSSDIILAYIRTDNLYFRAERDRYTVEYLLLGDLSTKIIAPRLVKTGMNGVHRLQFFLQGALYSA